MEMYRFIYLLGALFSFGLQIIVFWGHIKNILRSKNKDPESLYDNYIQLLALSILIIFGSFLSWLGLISFFILKINGKHGK